MDAISILNGLKNKILDAKNYELLKHTYDLQNQNIEQLKTSNEGFKEDNKRLREEVDGLKAENESLKQTVAKLTQKVSQLSEHTVSPCLSDVALAILELYRQHSGEPLYKKSQIIPSLISNFSKIQIESGIDDLEETKMIEWSHRKSNERRRNLYTNRAMLDSLSRGRYDDDDDDVAYSLTKQGRKHLA